MMLFSVTYEIVTQESAEDGEAEEMGFISQGVSLRDAIDDVTRTRTNAVDGVSAIECDTSHVQAARWVTIVNGMEFETGAYESRSLHMPESLTAATRVRIARLLGVRV
jgi:hypothetical protein